MDGTIVGDGFQLSRDKLCIDRLNVENAGAVLRRHGGDCAGAAHAQSPQRRQVGLNAGQGAWVTAPDGQDTSHRASFPRSVRKPRTWVSSMLEDFGSATSLSLRRYQ